MGLGTRSGALVCAALLAACSGRVTVPPAAETERTPEAAYAAVRQQEAAIRTLRARFRAAVRRGTETRVADGVLVVKKPDRFRLRLLSPFGFTVFDYTSWDAHDRMELPLEGKLFHDAEIAEVRLFPLDGLPADMWSGYRLRLDEIRAGVESPKFGAW